jgi:hypothetical protein
MNVLTPTKKMENLTTKTALEFLKSKGFYTDCLFHRGMIKEKYNISNEQADEILKDVVEQDGYWERIYDDIDTLCEFNQIKPFDEITQLDILKMSRQEVINFLCYYDRNGVYRDQDCEDECISPLTLEAAQEYAIRFLDGNGWDSEEFGDPTENQHFRNELLKKINQ